jgi:hypothetical protein
MTVTIDGLVFESSNYDADGDVLYLGHGESNVAADALLTSEGHGVRFDCHAPVAYASVRSASPNCAREAHEPELLERVAHATRPPLIAVLGS